MCTSVFDGLLYVDFRDAVIVAVLVSVGMHRGDILSSTIVNQFVSNHRRGKKEETYPSPKYSPIADLLNPSADNKKRATSCGSLLGIKPVSTRN